MDRTRFFTRLYRGLLCLYPSRFRTEFADEMESVFDEVIFEASSRGRLALVCTLVGEYASIAGEALTRYAKEKVLAERAGTNSTTWEGPPSVKEALVALAVFALPAAYVLSNKIPGVSTPMQAAFSASLLLLMFLAGLLKGFPRWSLPSLGLALSAISFFFTFQHAADLTAPPFLYRLGFDVSSRSAALLLQACWAGMMWLCLFIFTFLAIRLLAVLRKFRSLLERIQSDWTLVSFILYSGALLILLLALDQYRYQVSHTIAITLCLVSGAWLYLRSPFAWQRTLALLAGLTLAMWTAIAGQWPAVLFQGGRHWLEWQTASGGRWFEASQAIFLWGWMVVAILAPATLRFLPVPRVGAHSP